MLMTLLDSQSKGPINRADKLTDLILLRNLIMGLHTSAFRLISEVQNTTEILN